MTICSKINFETIKTKYWNLLINGIYIRKQNKERKKIAAKLYRKTIFQNFFNHARINALIKNENSL